MNPYSSFGRLSDALSHVEGISIECEQVIDRNIRYYSLDLSDLFRFANMEHVSGIEFAEDLAPGSLPEKLTDALKEMIAATPIVLLALPKKPSPFLLNRLSRIEGGVLIPRDMLDALESDESPAETLRALIVNAIGVDGLSIYQSYGAVTGNRFFGRKRQLRMIWKRPEKSFLVTGARQSGKTSLLMEARVKLDSRRRSEGAPQDEKSTVYVDCRIPGNVQGLISEILRGLGDSTLRTEPDKWKKPRRWREFTRKLRFLAGAVYRKRISIFLDEYDSVLTYNLKDNASYTITWHFRELTQKNSPSNGYIQFVIAGSKDLAKLCKNKKSDLNNFLDPESCRLDNFDIGTTRELLTVPLKQLGFEIEDPQTLANLVLRETGGRPSSIQHLCESIIALANRRNDTVVNQELLLLLVQSGKFLEFHQNTLDENTDPLDRFILCCQAGRPSDAAFGVEDIMNLNARLGIRVDRSVVNQSLADLANSGFLDYDEGSVGGLRYHVSLPVIRRLYGKKDPKVFIDEMRSKGICEIEGRR